MLDAPIWEIIKIKTSKRASMTLNSKAVNVETMNIELRKWIQDICGVKTFCSVVVVVSYTLDYNNEIDMTQSCLEGDNIKL